VTIRALSIVLLAAALTACASPPGQQSGLDDFKARQADAAATAQADAKYREALMLWQTVATVDPGDAEAQKAILSLQSTIESETRNAVSEGKAAYRRGRAADGDRWMLRALALRPGEPTALQGLRKSVSEASHNRQGKKVQSSYGGVDLKNDEAQEKPANKAPIDPAVAIQRLFDAGDYDGVLAAVAASDTTKQAAYSALARDAHLALAARAQEANKLEEQLGHLDQALATGAAPKSLLLERQTLAERLSDDYHRKSLGLLKTDLAGAIEALEKSIDFNPSNISAKDKLDQALTLKRNLEKIKAR
jgi:hypothetical protein